MAERLRGTSGTGGMNGTAKGQQPIAKSQNSRTSRIGEQVKQPRANSQQLTAKRVAGVAE